jgi:predicted acylesterase/phospholipase RssA
MALLFSSCTMIQHTAVPEELVDQAEVSGFDGIRTWADEITPEFRQGIEARIGQLRKSRLAYKPAHVLALSGGGQNGAFGSGVLTGWSASGKKPEFEVVSGVSTGALIAPLAFLGSDYDETLKRVYTGITTRDVLVANPIGGLLGGSAIASNHPLAKIIDEIVDDELLAKTAEQHRRGRRLYVVTTNLEAQRPVVWNMSGIAASGRPGAEELFESLLLASAAIPAAFPPVPIQVEVDGQTFTELHVDGGTTANSFIGPINSRLPLPSLVLKRQVNLHVIQDGKLSPVYEPIKPRTIKIASRGIGTVLKYKNYADIRRLQLFARSFGANFRLISIPDSFDVKSEGVFDQDYMNDLYQLGYSMGKSGKAWISNPNVF